MEVETALKKANEDWCNVRQTMSEINKAKARFANLQNKLDELLVSIKEMETKANKSQTNANRYKDHCDEEFEYYQAKFHHQMKEHDDLISASKNLENRLEKEKTSQKEILDKLEEIKNFAEESQTKAEKANENDQLLIDIYSMSGKQLVSAKISPELIPVSNKCNSDYCRILTLEMVLDSTELQNLFAESEDYEWNFAVENQLHEDDDLLLYANRDQQGQLYLAITAIQKFFD